MNFFPSMGFDGSALPQWGLMVEPFRPLENGENAPLRIFEKNMEYSSHVCLETLDL